MIKRYGPIEEQAEQPLPTQSTTPVYCTVEAVSSPDLHMAIQNGSYLDYEQTPVGGSGEFCDVLSLQPILQ
jgi:hypothetical protein